MARAKQRLQPWERTPREVKPVTMDQSDLLRVLHLLSRLRAAAKDRAFPLNYGRRLNGRQRKEAARLNQLAAQTGTLATKLHRAWGVAPPEAERVTVKLTPADLSVLRRVRFSLGVESPRWSTRYRWSHHNEDTGRTTRREVTTRTHRVPPLKRRFRVAGFGKPVFQATTVELIHQDKESSEMGKTRKGKKNAKAAEAESADEDEIVLTDDDVEELDVEEPDAADEDDGDEEEDARTKKELKAEAKEAGVKGYSKMDRDELIAALEGDDEEEDEDDEDEDDGDELDSLDRSELRARHKKAGLGKVKKSQSDDDIRDAIRAAESEEDEEDEDEKPAKKRSKKGGKKSSGSKKGQAPPTRELPKGKLGASDVAKLAKTDGRTVRLYLRKNEVEKDEELGRYAFTKAQAEKLAKKIKKEQAS